MDMKTGIDEGAGNLAAERGKIAAYCRRVTGDAQIAQDLTQETLFIALRRAGQIPINRAYVYGIARRLCQNYRMQRERDAARFTDWEKWDETATRCETPGIGGESAMDPLDSLLKAEREQLIERALAGLKAEARETLIARYIHDAPLSELAARQNITENTAAVRLHRSREALKTLLSTKLRAEATTHGLLDADTAEGWRETPIICCRCGKEKLQGRFETAEANGASPQFALRCPTCFGDLIGMTSNAAPLDAPTVLGDVKGFRAGLNRVNRWWQGYLETALTRKRVPCPNCGRPARTGFSQPPKGDVGFGITCDPCGGTTFFIRPTGLLYHSSELHDFWRIHPRARNIAERPLVCEGRPAILTAFEDVTTTARIEMVFDRETMQKMR